jgi:dsRNA-specific ribonuclease
MSLRYHGENLSSGPQKAASKKAAEQLAAQALLGLVSSRAPATSTARVSQDDVSRLQCANPKGRLLEWCAQKKRAAPRFERQADPAGYRVRAALSLDNEETIVSAWHNASTLKAAEQAAAEAVLTILQGRQTVGQEHGSCTPHESQASQRNAAARLNELKQAGVLQSVGYEIVQNDGPSHNPVFSMVASATAEGGRTWTTAPVRASSKKSGQRLAAESLLDLLVEQGITRL